MRRDATGKRMAAGTGLVVFAVLMAFTQPAVTQEVARGGVTRDEDGQIKKTYEGTEAPKACPT